MQSKRIQQFLDTPSRSFFVDILSSKDVDTSHMHREARPNFTTNKKNTARFGPLTCQNRALCPNDGAIPVDADYLQQHKVALCDAGCARMHLATHVFFGKQKAALGLDPTLVHWDQDTQAFIHARPNLQHHRI